MNYDFKVFGQGPAVIFVHGWPFTHKSFRKIIPPMSKHFKCYALNSLGMANDGNGSEVPDMNFPDHARRIIEFADAQDLKSFSLLGHDTGASIARIVAATDPDRVNSLVLLNTEIPGHRPPFIGLYQKSLALPGAYLSMRTMMKSKSFRHSATGFGETVKDKSLIDNELKPVFMDHFMSSKQRFNGLRRYLIGLDLSMIDEILDIQSKVTAPTQFIWGQDDKTFPCALGKNMANAMPSCREFIEIENSCFLPQEEKPYEVTKHAIRFLDSIYQ